MINIGITRRIQLRTLHPYFFLVLGKVEVFIKLKWALYPIPLASLLTLAEYEALIRQIFSFDPHCHIPKM